MTLDKGIIGKTYVVTSINLNEEITRRLQILGVTKNSKISIINAKKKGALIVRIRGTRYALGRQFAKGIETEDKAV